VFYQKQSIKLNTVVILFTFVPPHCSLIGIAD